MRPLKGTPIEFMLYESSLFSSLVDFAHLKTAFPQAVKNLPLDEDTLWQIGLDSLDYCGSLFSSSQTNTSRRLFLQRADLMRAIDPKRFFKEVGISKRYLMEMEQYFVSIDPGNVSEWLEAGAQILSIQRDRPLANAQFSAPLPSLPTVRKF